MSKRQTEFPSENTLTLTPSFLTHNVAHATQLSTMLVLLQQPNRRADHVPWVGRHESFPRVMVHTTAITQQLSASCSANALALPCLAETCFAS